MRWALLVLLLISAHARGWAQISAVKAEPNRERRSERALDFASKSFDDARKAYGEGRDGDFKASLDAVQQAIELSYDSLAETGKPASPKRFKRAELRLGGLLRRIESLERDVSVEDRERVAALHQIARGIHDKMLSGVMDRRK